MRRRTRSQGSSSTSALTSPSARRFRRSAARPGVAGGVCRADRGGAGDRVRPHRLPAHRRPRPLERRGPRQGQRQRGGADRSDHARRRPGPGPQPSGCRGRPRSDRHLGTPEEDEVDAFGLKWSWPGPIRAAFSVRLVRTGSRLRSSTRKGARAAKGGYGAIRSIVPPSIPCASCGVVSPGTCSGTKATASPIESSNTTAIPRLAPGASTAAASRSRSRRR